MSRKKGDVAEAKACEYLLTLGYEIVERNFTVRGGEMDIIAMKSGVLHFIEVKSGSSYNPLYNITPKKLALVIKTAERYLLRKNLQMPFQIDAIAVMGDQCDLVENITL